MKFYSEQLNQLFDSEEELTNAEVEAKAETEAKAKAEQEKKENRAARAKEVEDAFTAANEAQKKANELLRNFIKDYGTFHTSIREVAPSWFDIFNLL